MKSQKTFADELVRKFYVTSKQNVPLRVGVKLDNKLMTISRWKSGHSVN